MALVALALCMKAMVPAGYMVDGAAKALTITICGQSLDTAAHIVIPQGAKSHDGHHDQEQASPVCPYAALAMAALSGADTVLLALALTFILVVGFRQATGVQPASRPFLRPPLRGPPSQA